MADAGDILNDNEVSEMLLIHQRKAWSSTENEKN